MPRRREQAAALVAALWVCCAACAQGDGLTADAAKRLTDEAATVYRAGDPARALEMLDRALAHYRATGNRGAEEDVHYMRGFVWRKLRDHAKALASFEAALAINRDLKSEGQALLLHEIGFSQLDLGRHADAQQTFAAERALHAAAGDRKAEAEALHNQGFATAARAVREAAPDRFAEALAQFEAALAGRRDSGDRAGEARTLEFIAQMHLSLGKPALGIGPATQAVAAHRAVGDAAGQDRASTLLAQLEARAAPRADRSPPSDRQRARLAEAHERQHECLLRLSGGDPTGARALCESALRVFADLDDRAGEAMAQTNLGVIDLALGRYGPARERLLRGLRLARELGGTDVQANATNALGAVDMATGRLPQALTRFELALAAFQRQHDQPQQDRARNNIAGLQVLLGRHDEAIAMYESLLRSRGVDPLQTLGNLAAVQALRKDFAAARDLLLRVVDQQRRQRDPLLRSSLGNLGAVLAELGDLAGARPVLEEALALDRRLGDVANESSALSQLAEVLARQGRAEEAIALYRQAAERARALDIGAAHSLALAGLGRVLEAQGETAKALDATLQAVAIDEAQRSAGGIDDFKTALAANVSDRPLRAARLLLRLQRPAEAFEMAERARARTLLDQLGRSPVDLRAGASAAVAEDERRTRLELAALGRLIAQERAKAPAQRDEARLGELQRLLADKRNAYRQVLTRLKAADPEYASLVDVAPPPLADLQRLLDADTTLLSYLVTPDAVLAFVVTRDSLKAVELPVGEPALGAAVDDLRNALGAPGDAPLQALQRLSSMLVDPLRVHLKTARLGIVPHGVLHLLPFAALHGGTPERWLGEAFELFHLPSASVLPFVAAKRKPELGGLLALAQGRAPGLPPLRHAEAEARAVAALLGGTALVGADATEAALRDRAPRAGVLHLAAHGQLNAAAPLFSRLVLAGDDDLDTARDGMLEVREVYGLDLRQTSLVVLSACQTQLGALSRGDDMVGLNRAFLFAGAPAVVASLWKVDDEATALLMTALYGHLKRGLGPAAALQAAQADTRARHPDPFHWAAFVLTGSPR